MMDVEGRPRVVHPVSSYIDYSKDKQGFTQVIIIIFILSAIIIINQNQRYENLSGKSTPSVLGEGGPPPSDP